METILLLDCCGTFKHQQCQPTIFIAPKMKEHNFLTSQREYATRKRITIVYTQANNLNNRII